MESKLDALYLDLLKKTLSFTLWPEPPVPLMTFNYARSPIKKFVISAVSKLLNRKNLQIAQKRVFSDIDRLDGGVWSGYADSMIGIKRLDNLQYCIEDVLKNEIQGDFIETGVWRGGACIFMRAVLAARGVENRKVFVADSFEGLPKPDIELYPADKGDTHHIHDFLAVSEDTVKNNFMKYGMLDNQVVFLKGWFKDTLPVAPIELLSILRLDGDMYSSTIEALEILYPKLSVGGYCIVDDYAIQGCKLAVDDFRKKHKIESEMKQIDWTGVYWKK